MKTPQDVIGVICGPGYRAIQLRSDEGYRLAGVNLLDMKLMPSPFVRTAEHPGVPVVDLRNPAADVMAAIEKALNLIPKETDEQPPAP